MSEHLSAAAAAMNVPESLVQRSAEARAKATGGSADDVLAAWAGGDAAPAGATAPATPAPAPSEPEPPAAPEPTPEPTPQPTPTAAASPTPPATPTPPTAVTPPPAPKTVTPSEALRHDVVVSVRTAGLKERTNPTIPRWLAVLFMIIPAFGLLYLTGATAADECNPESPFLVADRVTGELANCDGSAFEGGGGLGGAGAAFVSNGREAYLSSAVGCAGCHGPNGGGGTGPAFANVLVTFGSCSDHVEWVRLGSSGFQAAGNSTYGDIAKPIAGGMPAFGSLSDEELRSIVAFERIVFGGADADATLADCGLVEAPAEDGAVTETTEATG